MDTLILIYLFLNLLAFLAFGLDKIRAKAQMWRTTERTLLAWCLVGGPGALLGMWVFRHKTRKPIFWLTASAGALGGMLLVFALLA